MSGHQLANSKYRNWVKAGLGLKFVKEGLEPFCDDIVKQQHVALLNTVKQKHNLTTVNCGLCQLRTLQPDHVRTRNKQCPLGQKECNCQYSGGKVPCPNNVCGAIYDEIINLHASTPPAPYWRNTDVQLWCTEPWVVATCFINAPGYTQKFTALEIDCSGLLHLIINNKDLQTHVHYKITGTDVFSMVRKHRNTIFHCESMKLEDTDVNTYIDDMIDVLQDSNELKHRNESIAAAKKLVQLKQHDFIITTSLEAEVKAARTSLKELHDELERKLKADMEQKGSDIKAEVEQKGSDIKAEVEQKCLYIKAEVEQKGLDIKEEVEQKGFVIKTEVGQEGAHIKADVQQTGLDIKAKLEQNLLDFKSEIEQKGSDIKLEVEQKGFETISHVKAKASDIKLDMERKGSKICSEMEQKVSDFKSEMGQKSSELKTEIKQKGLSTKAEIEQKGLDIRSRIVQKGLEVEAEVLQKATNIESNVEQKYSNTMVEMEHKSVDIQTEMQKKTSDLKTELEKTGSEIKSDLEKKRKESSCHCTEPDHQRTYSEMKKELQRKLVNMFNDQVTMISALPLLPDENLTDIVDVYVPPLITLEKQDDRRLMDFERQSCAADRQSREVEISVSDIFRKAGKPVRLIYVLGYAGSGKTTFCKYLASNWCAAHSHKNYRTTDIDLRNEMRKFDFLFFISLRHYSDCYSIKSMLNEVYPDPVLHKLLQNESENCLIVLDGLDEWTPKGQKSSMFQTKGLPERDISKNYTIITTSTSWKFTSLRIKKSEVDQTIKLGGIGDNAVKLLTKNTVDVLNERFSKKKATYGFDCCIKESSVSEMCHTPMILQQLICLWFDKKLKGTSKCAVYSSMLELFFDWAAQKDPECQGEVQHDTSNQMNDLQLPDYLSYCDSVACSDNKQVIYCLAHLAYETLFDKSKENSLTFTASKLKLLKINNNMKTRILRTGILSEDAGVTLLASKRQEPLFSFVHKSIQEYLAAVYIAAQFEAMTKDSAAAYQNYDVAKDCLYKYLGACKTIEDIFEQSNVFIMLCGLQQQLATCISEYIYDIVAADKRVKEYRTSIKYENYKDLDKLLEDIQICIINCIKEVISSGTPFQSCIHIGDIVSTGYFHYNTVDLLDFNVKVIISDSVRSLCLTEHIDSAMEYLTNCKNLKSLRCYNKKYDERISEILVKNTATLECVDIRSDHEQIIGTLLQSLPNMHQLISLQIGGIYSNFKPPHEVCNSLSTLLTQATGLQQISINFNCDHSDKHLVDLSSHKQLQYVELRSGKFFVTKLNTDNLVTYIVGICTAAGMIQTCDNLYKACNLENLELRCISRPWFKTVSELRSVTENVTNLLNH